LVAFHYNQFDVALRKTRSPRVARVARRFASLLGGHEPEVEHIPLVDLASLDYVLSDTETERVLSWASIALDGTAENAIDQIESAIKDVEPVDQLKLRVVAAEHYLARGQAKNGLQHANAVRHSKVADAWASLYRERLPGAKR
jgi:hypothetical protein